MDKKVWLKPGKEYIVKRKARKNHVCHECSKPIFKGEYYIEDVIKYVTPRFGKKPFLKWYHNKICLKSWRGIIPK